MVIFEKIKKELPAVQRNILLKKYNTFQIGGPAKYFYEASSKQDLIKAVMAAKKFNLPFFVLGGGSNILVSDSGYKGLVIKTLNCQNNTNTKKIEILNSKIIVEAGCLLKSLVSISEEKALTGFEWAAGIPGTFGGAIKGNAGAFDGSMKNVVKKVEAFDVKKEKIIIFTNKDCRFGYRSSVFKKNKNLIIISAEIQLKKGNKNEIQKKIQKYLDYRKKNHPLNFPSAGSVFKNIVLRFFILKQEKEKIKKLSKELEKFKKIGIVPAAWLIDKCGLKGKKIGEVGVSKKHANFIINLQNGKAQDIRKLIKLIKQKVKSEFKIQLEEEIEYL